MLKVWQLERLDKGVPFCSRIARVSQALGTGRSARAMVIAATGDRQHLAVGFADSSVLLYPGSDFSRER